MKIILDMLNLNSVSVMKIIVGEIWRRAYINSVQGRMLVQNEVPEPFKSKIFAMWGNTASVKENI